MFAFLFFIIGFLIGGLVGITVMSLLHINHLRGKDDEQ